MGEITLTFVAGPGEITGRETVLQPGRTVFGRSPDCDVVMPDSNISRLHFEVFLENGEARVKDLESTNGLMLNGLRTKEAILKDGDVLSVGPYRLRCRFTEAAEARTSFSAPPFGGEVLAEIPAGSLLDRGGSRPSWPGGRRVGRDLEALYRFAGGLATLRRLEDLGTFVADEARRMADAGRAAFLLIDESRFVPIEEGCGYSPRRESFPRGGLVVSRTVAEGVIRGGSALLIRSVADDARLKSAESLAALGVKSVICVPLKGRKSTLGLLYLDLSDPSARFNEEDLSLITAVADLSALAAENILAWEENRRLSEKLLASERIAAVGRVAGGVLHDLKSVLSVASLSAQVLKDSSISPERREHYANLLTDKIEEMVHLTEEMMDYAKGTTRIEHETVHVRDLVERAATSLAHLARDAMVTLEAGRLSAGRAKLDPRKMQRVFFNLGKNAVEAMTGGGVLRISAFEERTDLVLYFEESGPGVSGELREAIFEAFVTRGKEGGTGLGLAVARNIVKLHGGSIHVEDSSLGGARFVIRLPLGESFRGDETVADYSGGGSRGRNSFSGG